MSGFENLTLFTIADRNFLPGTVALINSLMRCGFGGDIVIGYMDGTPPTMELPPRARFEDLSSFRANPYCAKQSLILRSGAPEFLFCDSDIIVTSTQLLTDLERCNKSSFFVTAEGIIPPEDIRRKIWRERLNLPVGKSRQSTYFNSGFFAGSMKLHRGLLEEWDALTDLAKLREATILSDRDFPCPSQDVLNAILEARDYSVVCLSRPDWWTPMESQPFFFLGRFRPPALLHSTGKIKAWMWKSPPNHQPSVYDVQWYELAVTNPTAMKFPIEVSTSMRRWFEGKSQLSRKAKQVARRVRNLF